MDHLQKPAPQPSPFMQPLKLTNSHPDPPMLPTSLATSSSAMSSSTFSPASDAGSEMSSASSVVEETVEYHVVTTTTTTTSVKRTRRIVRRVFKRVRAADADLDAGATITLGTAETGAEGTGAIVPELAAVVPEPGVEEDVVVEEAPPLPRDERKDIIALLPSELALKCLSFLRGAKTLSRCSMVSRAWYPLATDDAIWRPLCLIRWSTKKHTPPPGSLHPRVDYTHLLPLLTVREMRDILTQRHIDTRHVVEKSELRSMVASTTPRERGRRGERRVQLDDVRWGGKWKASFITAEVDATRRVISKSELCGLEWDFAMLHSEWPEGRTVTAKFNRDYSYESDLFRGSERKMGWRFYVDDVQVEQYPALEVRRTSEWGFELTNQMAVFMSMEPGSTKAREEQALMEEMAEGGLHADGWH
ncbi:hypothetical protein HK101_004730 [Irineochytrium annulatum]|nr:hypothetical protein HK101_004730 [Irineochytrium annulatum]